MEDNDIKTNSLRAWLLASRPKTLTGAAVPVMIGTAMAIADAGIEGISVIPAVLCFAFAFIMQIDANFVNDYFDFVRGNDDETRLGPKRACAQGWVTVGAMKKAIIITTITACIAGFPLVFYGGIEMILLGAMCVLFCFLYTTKLSYLGLGDLLVIVFFGLVPVCATYYLELHNTGLTLNADVLAVSLSCGLVIDTLLIVNNYRDIDNDTRSGKRTLTVRIGAKASQILYLAVGITACVINVFVFSNNENVYIYGSFLIILGYLPFHIAAYKRMVAIDKGAELNAVLGDTARNMFIYGVLFCIGTAL